MERRRLENTYFWLQITASLFQNQGLKNSTGQLSIKFHRLEVSFKYLGNKDKKLKQVQVKEIGITNVQKPYFYPECCH